MWLIEVASLLLIIQSTCSIQSNASIKLYTSNDSSYMERLQPTVPNKRCPITLTEFIFYFCCQPVICFIGLILNVVNIMVFRLPQFVGAAYAYMIAMSIADAITLLINMPSGLLRCSGYFPYCHHWVFRKFRAGMLYYSAYVLFPVGNVSEAASAWFTVLLSVERYMAMRKMGISFRNRILFNESKRYKWIDRWMSRMTRVFTPFSTKTKRGQRCRCPQNINYKHSIAMVTIFSLVFNFPLFFVQRVDKKPRTYAVNGSNRTEELSSGSFGVPSDAILSTRFTVFGESSVYRAFTWLRIALVQVLPLLLLCIGNFCLFHFIKMAGTRRQQVFQQQHQTCNNPSATSNAERNRLNTHSVPPTTECKESPSQTCVPPNSRWQMAQRKLTILLVVIVALFLTGQIPQAFAYVTVFRIFGNVCLESQCCTAYYIYRAITSTLCLFTYAVNFFVYVTLNKHFKDQIRRWLHHFQPKFIQDFGTSWINPTFGDKNQKEQKFRSDFAMEHSPATFAGNIDRCTNINPKFVYNYFDYSQEVASAPVILETREVFPNFLLRKTIYPSPEHEESLIEYSLQHSSSLNCAKLTQRSHTQLNAPYNCPPDDILPDNSHGMDLRNSCRDHTLYPTRSCEICFSSDLALRTPNNRIANGSVYSKSASLQNDRNLTGFLRVTNFNRLTLPHSGCASVGDPTCVAIRTQSLDTSKDKLSSRSCSWSAGRHSTRVDPLLPEFLYEQNEIDVIFMDESSSYAEPKILQSYV